MGTDIRAIVEYAELAKETTSLDNLEFYSLAEFNLGRNSTFFGFLAGIRQSEDPAIPVRGLPANISYGVKAHALVQKAKSSDFKKLPTSFLNKYSIIESYTGIEQIPVLNTAPETKTEQAEIEDDSLDLKTDGSLTIYNQKEKLMYKEGTFSHSWLTLVELKEVQAKSSLTLLLGDSNLNGNKVFGLSSIISTMEALEKEDTFVTRLVFWFS